MNSRLYWLVVAVMAWGIQLEANPGDAQKVAKQEEKEKRAVAAETTQVTVKEKDVKPITITDLAAQGNVSLNIRFIDQFDTMRRCEPGIECGKMLENTHKQLSKSLYEVEQKFSQVLGEFQTQAAALSETTRKEKEKELRRMEEDCKRKRDECSEEMNSITEKATVSLAQSTDSAVARVAQRENIDAVIETSTGRVVYKKPSLNITEKVIGEMNTEHRIQVAKAKQQKTDTVVAANTKAPAVVAPKTDAVVANAKVTAETASKLDAVAVAAAPQTGRVSAASA